MLSPLILIDVIRIAVVEGGWNPREKETYTYICYNKVRRSCHCSGPADYTAHILDAKIKSYFRELFAVVRRRFNISCLKLDSSTLSSKSIPHARSC